MLQEITSNVSIGSIYNQCVIRFLVLFFALIPIQLKGQNTYNYTGGVQSYIVPEKTYFLGFYVEGAGGGSDINNKSYGGCGAIVSGYIGVNPGEKLYIFVGSTNGYNGGGKGTGGFITYNNPGSSRNGGGASDIRLNGTNLSNRIIVAGAGGGAAGQIPPYTAPVSYYGEDATKIYPDGSTDPSLFAQGGNGSNYYSFGGGGGGGYYGGAGGNPGGNTHGGKAGSSFVDTNFCEDCAFSTSQNINDGEITIITPYIEQSINPFAVIPDQMISNQFVSITPPTTSSGLPVDLSISGPATISGNKVSLNQRGKVTITANQLGDTNYLAATPVSTSFRIINPQQINPFPVIPSIQYGSDPFKITSPSSTSRLPVSITILSGPATITNNFLSVNGAGLVVLAANQAGNSIYDPANQITTSFNVLPANQTIGSFLLVSNHFYGEQPFSIGSPTTSSGLPASISIKSGPATISGNTVSLTGVGTVTVAANQAGNANYNAAPEVTTSFVVTRASQTISSFSPIPSQVLGAPSFSIGSLTASSGLPVTLSIKSGPATISGTTVTLTGTGTVTVAANQTGDENWNAAPEVTTSFVVKSYGQTIGAFSAIPDKFYGAAPFLITLPTATSKLPVAVIVKSGPARISNNKVTITGAGTVVLAANQAGNRSYAPAAEVTANFTVYPANQTIRIPQKLKPPVQAGVYPLPSFNSTAGLPVSFSVMSGPAYISGSNYVVTGPGRVWVAVDQVGNSNYNAARQVSFYFDVGKSTQSISANGINIPSIPGTYALPSIYSSAGLPVDLMLVSGPVRDEGYPYYTITGPGLVTVRLKQAGNDYYKPAADLVVPFRVKLYDQAIYPFRSIQDQTYGTAPFVVPAPLASSGLPVTVSVKSGPARIRNGLLTITGRGVVTLSANQAGNVNYNAATPITTSFSVN